MPPHLHLDVAKKAANKNINLFIEKPLGLNSKGWNEIAEICKKKNLINYVAYCHRHINYTKNFTVFSMDLTNDYIKINSDYRS